MNRFCLLPALIKAFAAAMIMTSTLAASSDKSLHIQLNDAFSYRSTLATSNGGLVWAEGFRIQAQNIQIEKREGTTHIKAWGNLLLFYHDKLIRGDYLHFNVEKKTGSVNNALIGLGMSYVGAGQLKLNAKGSLSARNAWVSPYPNAFNKLALEAEQLKLNKKNRLFAQSISFRFLRLPLFYLPSGQTSLSTLFQDQFQLRFEIRSFRKSKALIRWKFFTSTSLDAHLLASYFWGRGFGTGLELKHNSSFQLRAQLVRDTSNEPDFARHRWRAKAHFEKKTPFNGDFQLGVDALSDHRFTKDFNFDAFDEKNSTQTFLRYQIQGSQGICRLFLREKLNSFQTVQRQLPSVLLTLHPKRFLFLNTLPVTVSAKHESSFLQKNFSKQTGLAPYQSGRHISKAALSSHARWGSLLLSAKGTGRLQQRSDCRNEDAITDNSIADALKSKTWIDTSLLLQAWRPVMLTPAKGHGVLLIGSGAHLQSSTQKSPDHHYLFDLQDCPSKMHRLFAALRYRYFPQTIGKSCSLSWKISSAWHRPNDRYELFRPLTQHHFTLIAHHLDATAFTFQTRADGAFKNIEMVKALLKHTFSDQVASSFSYQYFSEHYQRSCLEQSSLVKEYRSTALQEALTGPGHQLIASLVYHRDEMTSWRTDHLVSFGQEQSRRYRKHGISLARIIGRQWTARFSLYTGNEGHGFKVDLQLSTQPPVASSTLP